MLLTKFRVTEFRSVEDSGWIDVEQITALIGKSRFYRSTQIGMVSRIPGSLWMTGTPA